jgi:tetratricopeptide (TPR) repeat protein
MNWKEGGCSPIHGCIDIFLKLTDMPYNTILFLLIAFSANAQQAVIREVDRPMTTYPYSDPDPVARPGRVYPYFRFDGFTDRSIIHSWKMVELENDYIRLAIMPEIGGKVWEAYEKSRHYPFIFTTRTVKFRDIALRGPWTTGGLEFNFGDIGHATTVSTPVDYYTRSNPDGSVSCFIGATEWASRTTWRVEIKLEPHKAYFTTHAWWYNNTPVEQELYHWVNAGFKAAEDLEFIFPGTHYIGHVGETNSWPLDSVGRKISFYKFNDFGSYKSYHVLGRPSSFYGGYWHKDGMGFGHVSPYYEKLGRKIWILGLSQEATRWENLLTDSEGLNVELQSGRLFNQASPGSMFTPFKHVAFAPYNLDAWDEYWFPVKHTRGMTHASPRGVLNLRIEDGWLKIDWMALEDQSDTLRVLASGSQLLVRKLILKPLALFRDSVRWQGNPDQLAVWVGKDVITDEAGPALHRPLEAPADFDWHSAHGLLLRGRDLSNQKEYGEAERYLLRALEKDPNLVPALSQMAQIRYRQGLYEESLKYAEHALAVNTYDGEANYFWGLANEQAGRPADAMDGYAVATLSPSFRQAAYLRIAYLAVRRQDWHEARHLLIKCLEIYPLNEAARNALVAVLRKQGNPENAQNLLNELLWQNPLNHFARFERYLNTGSERDRQEFTSLIRQEPPHETYIEMALQYYQWNMPTEALRLLELAPVHPMVQLWQGYLLDKKGEIHAAGNKLNEALAVSPMLIFPFRPEMVGLFIWADQNKPNWKWRYYEALVRWQHNQPGKARDLFSSCGTDPAFVPFYLAKAELFGDEPSVAEASLDQAFRLDPADWRTGLKLSEFYSQENRKEDALRIALKNHNDHPGSFVVGLQYAQILRLNGRYADALAVLNTLNMLPAEGDINAHALFRETHILYALELMKTGKYKKAVQHLQEAETWPENLFSGEPYMADNRLTRFITAYCHEKLKDQQGVQRSFDYIRNYKNPYGWTSPLGNTLSRLVADGDRDFSSITNGLLKEQADDRDNEVMQKFREIILQ